MSASHDGLHAAIAELAGLNDDPASGGITREVFTPTYDRATELVRERMRRAGLEVRLDAFGNLWGRWEGSSPELPAVLTGSHYDTTLNAGAYDGVLGVLGAIAGFAPERTLEVIGFAGEEPRFGTGCIGSRAMVGALSDADLRSLVDRDGVSLADALSGAGLDPDGIGAAVLDAAAVHVFVELHIEQGAVLESEGVPIGVVEAIAAPHDFRVTLEGAATHAGATPMGLRRDALAGAAEVMSELESITRSSPSATTVATVGVIRARPGAINVVPGVVELDIDVRDSDADVRDRVIDRFLDRTRVIAGTRGLSVEVTEIVRDEPVACSPLVTEATRDACAELGLEARDMISGAYHDAMVLGTKVPIGMIFVPSKGGVSHHPDEYTSPEEIDRGVDVLGAVLARLSRA